MRMNTRLYLLPVLLLTAALILFASLPVYAATDASGSSQGVSGKVLNDDLSRAVESQSKDALKNEVSKIGGSIVNAVRALFITFIAVAVIFMGLQAAGGGLRDPRKVELIKGGGISAAISAILVYKAEAIVAFVLNTIGVGISDVLK